MVWFWKALKEYLSVKALRRYVRPPVLFDGKTHSLPLVLGFQLTRTSASSFASGKAASEASVLVLPNLP